MITAKGCVKCEEVKQRLVDIAKSLFINVHIKSIESSTEEAIQIGIKYLLDDIPSFVIDERGFSGTDFSYDEIRDIMEKFL